MIDERGREVACNVKANRHMTGTWLVHIHFSYVCHNGHSDDEANSCFRNFTNAHKTNYIPIK
jgi:hypothetical protein